MPLCHNLARCFLQFRYRNIARLKLCLNRRMCLSTILAQFTLKDPGGHGFESSSGHFLFFCCKKCFFLFCFFKKLALPPVRSGRSRIRPPRRTGGRAFFCFARRSRLPFLRLRAQGPYMRKDHANLLMFLSSNSAEPGTCVCVSTMSVCYTSMLVELGQESSSRLFPSLFLSLLSPFSHGTIFTILELFMTK